MHTSTTVLPTVQALELCKMKNEFYKGWPDEIMTDA